jgi:hypothetical protein
MSSSPQPSSTAAAIAAAPESAGAVDTAPQEDAAMEPGEIPSMEERPSATSNVVESKGESGVPSLSLSQYEQLDDPQIPVHKIVHYEGDGAAATTTTILMIVVTKRDQMGKPAHLKRNRA